MPRTATGPRVAMAKASVIESRQIVDSNLMAETDLIAQSIYTASGALVPDYDPDVMCEIWENSSNLRPNIDSYVNNIDGFGWKLEAIIDPEAQDADDQIAEVIEAERLAELQGSNDDPPKPTASEIAARKEFIRNAMRREKMRASAFFDSCCQETSFVGLRRITRQDFEIMGSAAWEVLRTKLGRVAQLNYVPFSTVRLLPLAEHDYLKVPVKIRVSKLTTVAHEMRVPFRRYIQVWASAPITTATTRISSGGATAQVVYFKEFSDPRVISRKTGQIFTTVDELKAKDPKDEPATELIHFRQHNPRSQAYGIPRWSGAFLSVVGTRQAEEVNYLYFDNKSIPPYIMMISGGRLAEGMLAQIREFFENRLKGRENFHKFLVVEADPASAPYGPDGAASRMRIELKSLMDSQHRDGLFLNYDERNADKVGQTFRLPRLLRGDSRDFNKSTAEMALKFAEMQVFSPERVDFDHKINHLLMDEIGVRHWQFVSNGPVVKDSVQLTDVITKMVEHNVLTPAEARELATDVFNRPFEKIDAPWVDQPIALIESTEHIKVPAAQMAAWIKTPEQEKALDLVRSILDAEVKDAA